MRKTGLEVDDNRRAPLLGTYSYHDDRINISATLTREQLAGEAWDFAALHALELFSHFGWTPAVEVIKDAQSELRGQARRSSDPVP